MWARAGLWMLALSFGVFETSSALAGTLDVDASYRWSGDFGLGATGADSQPAFVQTDTPDDETHLVVRFYFNASQPTFGLADPMLLFVAKSGTSSDIVKVTLIPDSPTDQLSYTVATDTTTASTTNIPISTGWHFLEFEWTAATATGADNGALTTRLDNAVTAGLSNLDNDLSSISSMRWGIVSSGVAHTGTLRLDDFAARRSGPIGPVLAESLDLDGDGSHGPLTDGLLLLRALFGFTGATLTTGDVAGGCDWCDSAAIGERLGALMPVLDIDGNGSVTALTDGLLALRYLFGFRGPALITGAVGPGAQRDTADEIEPYIASLL